MKLIYCKNCQKQDIVNSYQDKTYGKFIRWHNESEKKGYTCTVCGAITK